MIGLNDFQRQWRDVEADATGAFSRTGASGWYVLGREVSQFEAELAAYWGIRYAVGVASGLDAIEISLRALGCGAGDKVLTTPVSAFATTLAIVKLGAVPVFVNISDSGLMDLATAEKALRRDPSIRYMVPVHLFGQALDLNELRRLVREFGIAMVEDCAQAIGTKWEGKSVGTAGSIAATSFYPTKNLGAMGDAGAILTDDEELARKALELRDYGQAAKYDHHEIGYNSRLDELQAAILRSAGLPRISKWTCRRREIAARYLREISHESISVVAPPSRSESSWHLFPVLVPQDLKLCFLRELRARGIHAGEHYPQSIPDQRAMQACRFEVMEDAMEGARRFCRSEVSLPIHPYLTDEEVSAVIGCANQWRP